MDHTVVPLTQLVVALICEDPMSNVDWVEASKEAMNAGCQLLSTPFLAYVLLCLHESHFAVGATKW